MTVKELREQLEGVPDDTPVVAHTNGGASEALDAWGAGYSRVIVASPKDEDKEVRRFIIYC